MKAMGNKSCIIVVPAYSATLRDYEAASWRQTLRIFGKNRKISLLTYKGLNLEIYKKIALEDGQTFSCVFFDKKYFKDVDAYTKLCLQRSFYKAYQDYDYMLICQLDAWVFRDDLDYWMNGAWDYVGTPWYWYEGGKWHPEELTVVGNGGLSLRRNKRFIDILSPWYNLIGLKPLVALGKKEGLKRCVKTIVRHLILEFYPEWHRRNEQYFEDQIFCLSLLGTEMELSTPPSEEALLFSFEILPSKSFERTNRQLPMGCHAFHRNEFEEFWKNYISF